MEDRLGEREGGVGWGCTEGEIEEASDRAGVWAGQVREHFAGLGRVCGVDVLAAAPPVLGGLQAGEGGDDREIGISEDWEDGWGGDKLGNGWGEVGARETGLVGGVEDEV